MAVEDGVEFMELLSPVKLENGKLICEVMVLGDMMLLEEEALLRRENSKRSRLIQ